MWIIKLSQCVGKVLTISRKTMPSLKATVMRDFFSILNELNLYQEQYHNKTDNTYVFFGNLIEFVSLDQPQKKRGAKRNYLWLNETNEFTYEDYIQMALRTSENIFLDYNPSDEYSYIYDKIIPRKDCTFIKSTYLDNPFLEQGLIDEIERLKDVDDNYWRIYGLGERGRSQKLIYTNWDIVSSIPENYEDVLYGIDFGFNNPSVLIAVYVKDCEYWIDELIYKSHLTNAQFMEDVKEGMGARVATKAIKADSAEPARIQEFMDGGFNIIPVIKGKDSVKNGIDNVKRVKLHITERSINAIKEIKSYQWKSDMNGNILDEPIKFNDHVMDAIRYTIGLPSESSDFEINETIIDSASEDVRIGVY